MRHQFKCDIDMHSGITEETVLMMGIKGCVLAMCYVHYKG